MKIRRSISILLLLIITWQGFYQCGYLIYWKINQNYIIENFCINKNKPELHCNGKCHLAKELNKVENTSTDQQNIPSSIFKLKFVDLFILDSSEWNISIYKLTYHFKNNSRYLNKKYKEIFFNFFRPPRLV